MIHDHTNKKSVTTSNEGRVDEYYFVVMGFISINADVTVIIITKYAVKLADDKSVTMVGDED